MRTIALYSIYLLATLTVLVTGSESQADPIVPDIKDPKMVKQDFYFSLIAGNVPIVKSYIDQYDYLTQQFNVDIFTGLLKCFKGKYSIHEDCMEIFELLKPSFLDVSGSISTPLIHAIIYNNLDVTSALLRMPEAKELVDKVDQFGRTALMYAAKWGNYSTVQLILNISTESVNLKDKSEKTALHYACEMIPSIKKETLAIELPNWLTGAPDVEADKKKDIFNTIFFNNAAILKEGPEYKLTTSDYDLSEFITQNGGKVQMESSPRDLLLQAAIPIVFAQFIKLTGRVSALTANSTILIGIVLANPVMLFLNDLCYKFQQFVLPGVDLNFVVSMDLGDKFQDFSFNIFFVLFMVILVKKAMGMNFGLGI